MAKSSPTLVFIHAFPLNSRMWASQIEALSASHRCVSVNLPGFGSAEASSTPVTFEAYVDDFERQLKLLDVEKSTWIGLSMGGYVALRALERFPERAERVVLCDTKSGADNNKAKLNRWSALQSYAHDCESFVTAQFKALVSDKSASNPALLKQFREMVLENPSAGVMAGIVALASRTDTTESLAAIKVPTLIMVGAEDKVTPPTEAEAMHKAIPGSRLEVIAGAGHLTNLEDPAAFNAALKNFLAN